LEKLGLPLGQELATDFILASLPPNFGNFVLNYHLHGAGKGMNALCDMQKMRPLLKELLTGEHVMQT